MKKFYILYGILIALTTYSSFSQVLRPRDPGISGGQPINLKSMVGDTVIWVYAPGPNEFVVSSDNGATWQGTVPSGLPTDGSVNGLSAVSATTAYVCVGSPTAPGVYVTNNGGSSWSYQVTGFDPADNFSFANLIHFFDAQNGVVVGDPDNLGYFEIYITSNGGNNWTRVPQANLPASVPNEFGVNVFYDTHGDNIWFLTAGQGRRLLRSNNRGVSWTATDMNSQLNLSDVYYNVAIGDNMNAIVYKINSNVPTLYATADGGATFSPVTTSGLPNANSIDYVPNTTMLGATYAGNFYFSKDRGLSWESRSAFGNGGLSGISFATALTGYATSANGTVSRYVANISLVGSSIGTPWTTDFSLFSEDGLNYSGEFVIPPGEVKFRLNNTWLPNGLNWGGSFFPSGVPVVPGDNIIVPGGRYSVTFNPYTVYNFQRRGFFILPFLDINTNGIVDSGDQNFPLGTVTYVKNDNGVQNFLSGPGGLYIEDADAAATFDISYAVNAAYQPYYTPTITEYLNLTNTATSPGYLLFPITQVSSYPDVEISLTGNDVVAGTTNLSYVTILNRGTASASGTVSYAKSPLVTINDYSGLGILPTNGLLGTTTATGIDIAFTNIPPMTSRVFTIKEYVPAIPTVSLGQQLTTSVTSTTTVADPNPSNNSLTVSETVVASYDPNDKAERHGPEIIATEFPSTEYLYYTIRFENEGTYNAFYVEVNDILDDKLDASTIQMVASKHSCQLTRTGSSLTWRFYNISLPPASVFPDYSQGFVTFRVKPLPGYVAGDIIPNSAEIIFDTNPAITTNTWTTTFVAPLSVADASEAWLRVYPNPTQDVLNLQMQSGFSINAIRLLDVNGRVVLAKTTEATTMELSIGHLTAGVYLLEAESDKGRQYFRVVKK